MALPRCKAIGERGSWFALIDGERLPCVHRHWVTGTHHCDPNVGHDVKWTELIEAISELKRVVLTSDHVSSDEKSFVRTGYIAVFRIDNLSNVDGNLEFDLVERLIELD